MTTALLAPIDLAALDHGHAQVLAGDRAAQLRQCQEECVIGGVEQSAIRELGADRRDERVAQCKDTHDLELRLLAQPGEQSHASEEKAEEHASRPVKARREGLDHRRCVARTTSELHVGCGRLVSEP